MPREVAVETKLRAEPPLASDLPDRLFEGPFERSLANLFLSASQYRHFFKRSPNVASALYLLVAGSKALLGHKTPDDAQTQTKTDELLLNRYSLEAIGTPKFADQLLAFISDRAISTNEAGRISLVRFGLSFALQQEAQQDYLLLDGGSSAALHLLWDALPVEYTPSPSQLENRPVAPSLEQPATIECVIRDVSEIPSFLDSWKPPKATLAVDQKALTLDNCLDVEWLRALTPIDNTIRQRRLCWAIQQRKKVSIPFLQADITEHLTDAMDLLPTSYPLMIVHTFMMTGWDIKKHASFTRQLENLSVRRPFYEIAVELDDSFMSKLKITQWSNKGPNSLVNTPCDPQGEWINAPFCASPVFNASFKGARG